MDFALLSDGQVGLRPNISPPRDWFILMGQSWSLLSVGEDERCHRVDLLEGARWGRPQRGGQVYCCFAFR